MESILQIIVILSVMKFACKAVFYKDYTGILFFAVLAGVFAYLIHPFIIKNEIRLFDSILSEKTKITGLALIVTAEAISGIMAGIAVLQNLAAPKKKKRLVFFELSPGIIIFGAVFYIELKAFYILPGASFSMTSLAVSVGLCLIIAIIAVCIKRLLPERVMQYELNFFINAMLLIVAVVLNAGLADYNRGNYSTDISFSNMIVFFTLSAGVAAAGYLIQKINKGKLKNLQKWI